MSKTKPTKNKNDFRKLQKTIFTIFLIGNTIFSIAMLILWYFCGVELTTWQLLTTALWLVFVVIIAGSSLPCSSKHFGGDKSELRDN